MENDETSIRLSSRTRDRLRAAKVGGENYDDVVNRLINLHIGNKGRMIEVVNPGNGRVRAPGGDEWLEPGETVEVWSEDPDVIGARRIGRVEEVSDD